jgi:hypothetical protein
VVSFDERRPLSSEIVRARRVSARDVIVHPALLLAGRRVYPALTTKYYEDGGEVGEHFIHDGKRWRTLGPSTRPARIDDECLGFVSKRDVHEYQAGSFDNRKDHERRFAFYASQLGRKDVRSFTAARERPPGKLRQATVPRKVEAVRSLLLEGAALQRSGQVARGNQKVRQAGELVAALKRDGDGRSALRTLLSDPVAAVWQAMMYLLLDVHRAECLKLIRKVAREGGLIGMAARMNLATIKREGRLA